MSTEKMDNKELMDMLSNNTQKVIKEFLLHYKVISHPAYVSAIANAFYVLGKEEVGDLDINDYSNIKAHYNSRNSKGAQATYFESFFKYIYAFNIVKNQEGFDKIWIKKELVKHFSRLLNGNEEKEERYLPSLTISQITKIENLLDLDYEDNFIMLRMSFLWYLIFHTECTVNEITKGIDINSLKTRTLTTKSGKEYPLPKKFNKIFYYIRDKRYTGLNTPNEPILRLGELVGIEKLTPQMIKIARKENMIKCSMCGSLHLNTTKNWTAINERIVCTKCAEELKKNENLEIDDIPNENIAEDNINDDINISSIIFTYDQLRSKLNKEIDYLKLHKFQIEIGKLGEAYVFDIERKKLENTPYFDLVDNTPAKDNKNGYDILSYDKEDGKKIYIEVKTEIGEDNDFYISAHELKTAKKLQATGERYYIYRVHNILGKSKNDINIDIIKDILNDDDFKLEVYTYRVNKKDRV